MDTSAKKTSSRCWYSRFRRRNRLPIDWKTFWKAELKFFISALLTMVGMGIGALALLQINKTAEGPFSKVACQALLGISSEPLMVVSAVLLVVAGLSATVLLILIPKTGWINAREVLKYSFKGIADFSTQLPLAVGAVGLASSSHVTAIPSLLKLTPICLTLAVLQHLVFSIIFYGVDHKQTKAGKGAALIVALAALALVIYLSTTLDWSRYLYAPRLCG